MHYIFATSCLLFGFIAAERLEHLRPSPLPTLSAIGHTGQYTAQPSFPSIISTEHHRPITSKPSHPYKTIPQSLQGGQSHAGISDRVSGHHHSVNFIPIVKENNDPNYGDGSYSYSYETGNGISASEVGVFHPGQTPEDGAQTASGSFSFTGPDNVVYAVSYTAGAEGFVPVGAHLPTPPPVPEAIQRAIQYNLGEEPSKRYYSAVDQAIPASGQRYTAAFTKQYPTYSTTPQAPFLNKLLVPNPKNSLDYRVEEDEENYTK